MAHQYWLGNYGGPLRTEVVADDGITPLLPISATITILNLNTGDLIVENAVCQVVTGSAFYSIPSGSTVTSTSAHYVGYMDVLVEAGNFLTNPIYFDVLDKASYLILYRWRRKVAEAAPDVSLLEDEDARDWVDSAVAFVNRRYGDTGYTSVLGSIQPAPTANDLEFFAEVASLMARTAWWAGKGKWRDEEMSSDPGPFKDEWERLDTIMAAKASNDIYQVLDVFNRDRVLLDSSKYDSPLWPYRLPGDVVPDTDIPI